VVQRKETQTGPAEKWEFYKHKTKKQKNKTKQKQNKKYGERDLSWP